MEVLINGAFSYHKIDGFRRSNISAIEWRGLVINLDKLCNFEYSMMGIERLLFIVINRGDVVVGSSVRPANGRFGVQIPAVADLSRKNR